MKLPVRRLDPAATLPSRAYDHDAGYDLHALEPARLGPGERVSVRTGIAIAVPEGHAALVLPRSGLAARHGIALVNAPGLIDAGYRGELSVVLINLDRHASFEVAVGMRIAQLVVTPVALPQLVEVAELEASARGSGGFGSTGGHAKLG